MTKYADTFDAVVLGNGGSLAPLTELVDLIDANGKARQVPHLTRLQTACARLSCAPPPDVCGLICSSTA